MVFISSLDEYIHANGSESPLRMAFATYLQNGLRPIERTVPNIDGKDHRNFKDIAELGFYDIVDFNSMQKFTSGLHWILGREYLGSSPLLSDSISLLGLTIGILQLKLNGEYKEQFQLQLVSKMSAHKGSICTGTFLMSLLKDDANVINGEENVNGFILSSRILKNDISVLDPVIKLIEIHRDNQFPYFHGDKFFENLVVHSNVKYIDKIFISSQSQISAHIEIEKAKVLEPIKTIIRQKSDKYAFNWMMGLVALLSLAFCIGCYFILIGDWDYFEPRTFLFFGTPILYVIIQYLWFGLTGDEFSLNPSKVYQKLNKNRQAKLKRDYYIK